MDSQSAAAGKRSKQKILDYKAVFGTEQGKRVLHDLLVYSNFLQPTLTSNNDPIEMAFNEGKRNVILRVLSFGRMDIRDIDKLIEEGERNAKQLAQRLRSSNV